MFNSFLYTPRQAHILMFHKKRLKLIANVSEHEKLKTVIFVSCVIQLHRDHASDECQSRALLNPTPTAIHSLGFINPKRTEN